MRVVVFGATGNVGTSVLDSLAGESAVQEVTAVARRAPERTWPRTTFVSADIAKDPLEPIVRGADVVVHLAWLIQPGRNESLTYAVNVHGSRRLFEALVQSEVPKLVYASSVGAYSPGPKDRLVGEEWPTDGIDSSFYARHKVAVERQLNDLEREHPQLTVVRMRPALIFKAQAATEIRRLFVGPFLPRSAIDQRLIPFLPHVERLRFQVVHSHDVGDAYRLAVVGDSRGAFNLAAEPPLGPEELGEILHARPIRVPARALRLAAATSFTLRLQPSEPGWVDMALAVPLMDSSRARSELGWAPRHDAIETLCELLEGMRRGSDDQTPPLARTSSGPARLRELITGVGARP